MVIPDAARYRPAHNKRGEFLMRSWMLVSLCLVGACSGAAEEKKAEGPVAAALAAGQWQADFETTAFRSTDGKTPLVTAKVGDKASAAACVEAGAEQKPAPALFVGEGYDCTYGTSYIRGGRVNTQLTCTHAGKGPIGFSVSGTSTADSFEGTAETVSYLPGEGDFQMTRKVTARRTGPSCSAPATKAA
jgi:hypothetical protein